MIKVCLDSQGNKLFQHILIGRPVFQPLKIAMKPMTDVIVFFIYGRLPALFRNHDSCRKPRRPGTLNINRLLLAAIHKDLSG
jgi:hypothetical protein